MLQLTIPTRWEFFGNQRPNKPFPDYLRSSQHTALVFIQPGRPEYWEELISWPDLPKTSQFSMLLRVGTGKQNEDPLAFVRLGKTDWSTVHNVTKK